MFRSPLVSPVFASPALTPASGSKELANAAHDCVYRLGADLFYANNNRFVDEVHTLVEHAPTPVRWFVVDAAAEVPAVFRTALREAFQ